MLTMTSHGLFTHTKWKCTCRYFMHFIKNIAQHCKVWLWDMYFVMWCTTNIMILYHWCMNCWCIDCGGWLLMEFFPTHVYNSCVIIVWLLHPTFFGHTQHVEFTLQGSEMIFPLESKLCYILLLSSSCTGGYYCTQNIGVIQCAYIL